MPTNGLLGTQEDTEAPRLLPLPLLAFGPFRPRYNEPMAYRIRRTTHEPRFELTPLLDVIFLLLTFFIFSQVMMVRAELLPVRLPQFAAGATAAEADAMLALTIDAEGRLYANFEPVTRDQLRLILERLAEQEAPPRVYVGTEEGLGEVDRLPVMLELVELLRATGIENFSFVGRPAPGD